MCEPMTVIAIAGAALSYVQQSQAASAANKSAEQSNAINLQAYHDQQEQINDQASADMSDRAREAMIERGRLRVIGGESGISGNSSDQLERQSYFNEGFDVSRIEGNRKNQIQQSYLNAQAGTAAAQSRANSVKQPSLIGAGLQIGGAYYGNQAREKEIASLTKKSSIN